MLEKYYGGSSKDVYNIVISDESWIYAYEPETKQQSTVWVFEPDLTKKIFSISFVKNHVITGISKMLIKIKKKKVICGKSTSKQMIACFFNKTGHVATVPLEQCCTEEGPCDCRIK